MNAPNDPQNFVPEILQEPGKPLSPPVPHMPPLEVTYNAYDNSVVDLRHPIYITDTIDAINVPEAATIEFPEPAPNVAPEAAVPQVSAATGEDSGTNTNISQATYPLVKPTVVVHDTNWYKEDLVSSIDING